MKVLTTNFVIVLMCCVCVFSIPGCGTLGSFHERIFPISKKKFEMCLDILYIKYPGYKIPPKWIVYNDWSERGYDFLDSRIIYFENAPEEMYYVDILQNPNHLADTNNVSIAIRSVFKGEKNNWFLNDDFNAKEKKRVEKRFDDEIISKLEECTKTKATKE